MYLCIYDIIYRRAINTCISPPVFGSFFDFWDNFQNHVM